MGKGKYSSYYGNYRNIAHYNREMAVKCLSEGMTPEQIAKEWPEIWLLTKSGKIKQHSQDIDISMAKVRSVIAKYRTQRKNKLA